MVRSGGGFACIDGMHRTTAMQRNWEKGLLDGKVYAIIYGEETPDDVVVGLATGTITLNDLVALILLYWYGRIGMVGMMWLNWSNENRIGMVGMMWLNWFNANPFFISGNNVIFILYFWIFLFLPFFLEFLVEKTGNPKKRTSEIRVFD
jgi:hypothetical protein